MTTDAPAPAPAKRPSSKGRTREWRAHELRAADDHFGGIADVKGEPELLGLARHILITKEAEF